MKRLGTLFVFLSLSFTFERGSFKTLSFNLIMVVSNPFFSAFFVSQEDLITRILKDFLTINDFCNLDSSVCNHKHRNRFLKCSKGSCFDGSMSIPLGDNFLNWARRRHVSVKRLCWRLDSQLSSSILRGLCRNGAWNLTFLTVSRSDFISLTAFLDIINSSKELEVLDAERSSGINDLTFYVTGRTFSRNLNYVSVKN
jgi:hypothetical protein